jgi:hypothetical protein
LAKPGDLDPVTVVPRYQWGGGFDVSEEEAAHKAAFYAERERQCREEREAKEAQRKREREAVDQVRERWEEQAKPIHFAGYWIKPGGKIVDYE